MAMKIGDVASRAGVSVETVRYYERLGVISEAERAASGYRHFDAEAVREVGFVKRAQLEGPLDRSPKALPLDRSSRGQQSKVWEITHPRVGPWARHRERVELLGDV